MTDGRWQLGSGVRSVNRSLLLETQTLEISLGRECSLMESGSAKGAEVTLDFVVGTDEGESHCGVRLLYPNDPNG